MSRTHLPGHWLALLCLLLSGAVAAADDRLGTAQVQLQLQPEQEQVRPGSTLWLGLRFELIRHWHVYWRNPGDSGEAPRLQWHLPAGWQAGEIHWPIPQRIPFGPLVNYGYEDAVTLLVPIQVPADAPTGGSARIAVDANWLVCREECIPQQGRLALSLPVGETGEIDHATLRERLFDPVRSQWPQPFPGSASYMIGDDGRLQLSLQAGDWPAENIAELWFASSDWGVVAPSGDQHWQLEGGKLQLLLPAGDMPPATPDTPLRGVLIVVGQAEDSRLTRGFSVEATASAADPSRPDLSWLLALGLAFAGGLLLNLMPCVLPVLSIKVLSLVQQAGHDSARHGLFFVVGVLSTFTLLAALLIGLRASGAALGWGFQLQQPGVIAGLMYLMLALALNLSGVFHLGGTVTGIGQRATERPGPAGSFATGVLAVIVATPCTAPFMGTALGFAMTQPAALALLVFLALGAGFALPLLLLSIWPRWLTLLPRPGAWMERLRNALAFPMYAAAAWLLWVLSQQVASPTLAVALLVALLLAFGLWLYGQPLRARWRFGAIVLVVLTLLGGLSRIGADPRPTSTAQPTAQPEAETWSSTRVAALREQGRAVFVNFTAAWCITCKVNEQLALASDVVQSAFVAHDIAYLKADWTSHDPAITAELERHGRNGVPLYLFYPAAAQAVQVLPQLLTSGLVLQAIAPPP